MINEIKTKRKSKFNTPNKPRKCATVHQVRELEGTFDRDPRPSHDKRLELAIKLDMHPRTVQIWFQNRRAKARSQNHLMVKSVNCSAPLTQIPAPHTLNYSLNKINSTLPQFNDILIPYCLSPKLNDFLTSQPIDNKNHFSIKYNNTYPLMQQFGTTTTNCNFNQNSYLTSPPVNSSPSRPYTPFVGNQISGEMLDPWGVPYQSYNGNLIEMGILSPYITNVGWTNPQSTNIQMDITKFKSGINTIQEAWDQQIYSNYCPQNNMNIE